MAMDKLRSSYQSLVQKWTAPQPDEKSAEEKLDTLLTGEPSGPGSEQTVSAAPTSPLDAFRQRVREELTLVVEEIQRKYALKGIAVHMDADDFLGGGRRLCIEISMQNHAMRLDGTVMEGGIAFNEVRSLDGTPGAICSGPMLRTRQLTPEGFREFVCGRIALLVRSILRQQR